MHKLFCMKKNERMKGWGQESRTHFILGLFSVFWFCVHTSFTARNPRFLRKRVIYSQEVITPGNKRSVFIVNLHSELSQTFTCLHLIQNKSLQLTRMWWKWDVNEEGGVAGGLSNQFCASQSTPKCLQRRNRLIIKLWQLLLHMLKVALSNVSSSHVLFLT